MSRIAAVAAATMALAAPAAASAGEVEVEYRVPDSVRPQVERMVGIGRRVHPLLLAPQCGLRVQEGPTPIIEGVGERAAGEAYVCAVLEEEGAPVRNLITLQTGYIASVSFAVGCSLIVHEMGHLAGLGHSDDPTDNMYYRSAHHPACGESDEAAAQRLNKAQLDADRHERDLETEANRTGEQRDVLNLRRDTLRGRAARYRRAARRATRAGETRRARRYLVRWRQTLRSLRRVEAQLHVVNQRRVALGVQ